jgi:hypothetical protein
MRKPDVYQIIIVILIIAIVTSLALFMLNLFRGKAGKAAVSVDVSGGKANVLINNEQAGETPVYKEGIYAKEIQIDINGSISSYSTKIKPSAGTLAFIKRDLGAGDSFSSGQNMWFEKIGGTQPFVNVTTPKLEEVSVIVDGVEMGKTPVRFSAKDLLTQKEDHKYVIKLSKSGYEDQTTEVKLKEGYELNIAADLFLNPIPDAVSSLTGAPQGVGIYNLSDVSDPSFTDKKKWAAAVNYWLETRGEVTWSTNKISKVNYFFDDSGKVYNEQGNEIMPQDVNLESGVIAAYLGNQQTKDLSQEAKTVFAQITGTELAAGGQTGNETPTTAKSLKIKPNTLGFLRVRSGAGTTNAEISQVNVGSEFVIKAEQSGWYKIEYEQGKEGWVNGSTQYVEVIEPDKVAP